VFIEHPVILDVARNELPSTRRFIIWVLLDRGSLFMYQMYIKMLNRSSKCSV